MGFKVGASYQPDLGADGASDTGVVSFGFDNGPGTSDAVYSIGAAYDGSFGDFGLGLSAAYQDGDDFGSDAWHVAGNVSFSGFKIAGGYEDDGSDEFYIGASYSTGPWTIAGGYSNDDVVGDNNEAYAAWVSYKLAPGVSATVGLEGNDNAAVNSDIAGLAYLQMNF